jgi:hypothetical protein
MLKIILSFSLLLLAACTEGEINLPDFSGVADSQPLIEIYSPLGDSSLPANTPFTIDYAVLRSSAGHHLEIRVNKRPPVLVYKQRGKHHIKGLPAGEHRIQITEYTKDGRATGGKITLRLSMVSPNTDALPPSD